MVTTICGLVYAEDFNGNPVNYWIANQYRSQKNRGSEGFGLFDGQHGHLVHAAKEHRIIRWLKKPRNETSLVMFHHRFPTSTINVRKAAHPFTTGDFFGDTEYVLIHNGMISNDEVLYQRHSELGIEYQSVLQDTSFNDSEALLWDFALMVEGKQDTLKARGAIAFICMKLVNGKLDKLYFGRNFNPLRMKRTADGLQLSSEGEGENILPDTLYTWHYNSRRLFKKELTIGEYYSNYSNNSCYPYSSSKDDYKPFNNYLRDPETGVWYNPETHIEASKYDDDPDVQQTAMEYLVKAEGVFEVAYWHCYADSLIEADNKDQAESDFLYKVAEYIQDDPDYMDKSSVSDAYLGIKRAEWQHVIKGMK